jgi:hypothetical protein
MGTERPFRSTTLARARARAGERAQFHQTRAPDCVDLETVALNVELRALGWLRRRGHLKEDHEKTPETESSAIDACLRGSLGMGELTAVPEKRPKAAAYEQDVPPRPTKSVRRGAESRGFDVHAGVTVAAADREGRDRLLRYCARPALTLERMSLLPDGRVAYALRKPWGKNTHRVMTPLSFMARLAALIPPPRHPLIRFAGVFAPHSSWRSKVVPERRGCSEFDGEHEHCGGACPSEVTGQARTSQACAKPGTITNLLGPGSSSAPTICMGGDPSAKPGSVRDTALRTRSALPQPGSTGPSF